MSSWLTGSGGGLQTTAWRSWNCTSVRALSGLVSWWMILVARANCRLSALTSSNEGKHDRAGGDRLRLAGAHGVGDAAHVAQVLDRLARGEPAGDRHDLVLAHAEDDQVGLGVEHDRPADGVAPVVVMRQPAERGLDAAGDDRHARKRLAGALAVGNRRAVGPQADLAAGRIGVVVAYFLVGRVMVDHAVHVAGADAEEQPGPAELPPGLGTSPVGLAQDRRPETRPPRARGSGCPSRTRDDRRRHRR